jgi:hypothetical protein
MIAAYWAWGVAMAFFGLFKSTSERDQETRETEAKLTRAHDMGRQISQTVTEAIDTFFDEKIMPVAANVNNAMIDELETHHHDETVDEAMNVVVDYGNRLKELKQRAIDGIWDNLGEWKSALIKMEMKEDFDRYIAHKLDPLWEELSENATAQLAYCVARITGHMTDEMHAMTPDELKDFVARRDADKSRGTT